MRIEKKDGSRERKILTAMIVDKSVLGRLATKWNKDYVQSRGAATIGQWCVDFYEKYEDAPGSSIENIFESWAETNKDEDTIEYIENLLRSLSGEYEQLLHESNSDYVVDIAAKHFNRVKMLKTAKAIEGCVETDELDKAHKIINEYSAVDIGSGSGIDILRDKEAIMRAFTQKGEPLIKYPDGLGLFFQDSLERDAFIVFLGAEKRGKSFWLMDMAYRGMEQGRKVAYFEVGDMSESQVTRRLCARVAGRPFRPGRIRIPTGIDRAPDDKFAVVPSYIEKEYQNYMDQEYAWKKCQELTKEHEGTLLKLSCHPNSSINVGGIRAVLRDWERQDGWIPDVIVIDYSDILAPMNGMADTREQINATWKQLRSLSQSMHCLVVTATQADAESYEAETLDRSNFSEDKRKNAHVTGMVGLNATISEEEHGIMRLNWIVLRDLQFSSQRHCHVAGCLGIANPALYSTF